MSTKKSLAKEEKYFILDVLPTTVLPQSIPAYCLNWTQSIFWHTHKYTCSAEWHAP